MSYDNYPPGAANDPNAPYNQYNPDPVETDVLISCTLSKSTTIMVEHYTPCSESDEEGYHTWNDFDDTDFVEEYNNSGEYTIEDILRACKALAEEKLAKVKEEPLTKQKGTRDYTMEKYAKSSKIKQLENVINACEGWIIDEIIVEPE